MALFERLLFVLLLGVVLGLTHVQGKGYRESRINKSVRIETTSRPHVIDSRINRHESDTCMLNHFYVTNFLNTARWSLIRNRLGTGWDETLIPPLVFCVKVLDKPTNTKNICNKNTFELVIVDGVKRNKNRRSDTDKSIVVASVTDLLKGEERCILVSPCEILRRIYWDDDNFSNPINNLEFRINVSYESVTTNQRFIAIAGVKGVARSLHSSRNPWDNRMRITQKFKDVQAISLYVPYKPHSKSFISDSCIIKPRVTSVFYGKNKPSLCKFDNCMWNIWVGELAGEFVNERCTIGRSSSRGDYIVGWFSPYAIDSETIGSIKLKVDWVTNDRIDDELCKVSHQPANSFLSEERAEHHLRSNKYNTSDWFPKEDEQNSYEKIVTGDGEHLNNIGVSNAGEDTDGGHAKTTGEKHSPVVTTTTTRYTTITTGQKYKNHNLTEAEIIKGKVVISNQRNSKDMGICINGECRGSSRLWLSCKGNKTRGLTVVDSGVNVSMDTVSNNSTLNGADLAEPQIEWIELDYNSTIYTRTNDGVILYNIDGYINNTKGFFGSFNNNGSLTLMGGQGNESLCKHDFSCSCMVDGNVDEDITVVDYHDDENFNNTTSSNVTQGLVESDELSDSDFESINSQVSREELLIKWKNLKRANEG